MTIVTRTVSRTLFPIILSFGAYIALHGHVSAGGGFPAGVVAASAFAAIMISCGQGKEILHFKDRVRNLLKKPLGFIVLTGIILGLVSKALHFEMGGFEIPIEFSTVISNVVGSLLVTASLFIVMDSILLERGKKK